MFNSYTLSLSPTLSNLKATYSVFWTGSSSEGSLDGTKFPAIIRLFGSLMASEKADVKRIDLFLYNILPFYNNSANNLANTIFCNGT